jgi:hypothetical protein
MLVAIYKKPGGSVGVTHFNWQDRLFKWVDGVFFSVLNNRLIKHTGTPVPDAQMLADVCVPRPFREFVPDDRLNFFQAFEAESEMDFAQRKLARTFAAGQRLDKRGNKHGGDSLPEAFGDVFIIDASLLPADKYFRPAWSYDASDNFVINMFTARDVQRDHIRRIRRFAFRVLDAAFVAVLARHNLAPTTATHDRLVELTAIQQRLAEGPQSQAITDATTLDELRIAGMDCFGDFVVENEGRKIRLLNP